MDLRSQQAALLVFSTQVGGWVGGCALLAVDTVDQDLRGSQQQQSTCDGPQPTSTAVTSVC